MQIDTTHIRPDIIADIIIDLEDSKSPNSKIITDLKQVLTENVGNEDAPRFLAAAWTREFGTKETPYGTDPTEPK